tara:strand:+ start:4734 stop:5009 length:276 start_codon:yes stop_codon:yes gene_type:complete
MKKGYHDYTPIIKEEKKPMKIEKVKATHEPKYITTPSGIKHMISDERGMVVAGTDVLMLGSKLPAIHSIPKPAKSIWKMSTKDYIKYNGKF